MERSVFQTIVVADDATRRCMRFDAGARLNQSCQLRSQPEHLAFDYTRAMVAVLLLAEPAPRRILLIGVGGGSVARALSTARADFEIDAVDIDAAVLRIAERHFGLARGPRLRLHVADGGAFVARAKANGDRFDAVLLDAFDAHGLPPGLFNEGFLRDVRTLLAPDGLFLANLFAGAPGYDQELELARSAFGPLHELRVGESGGNRLLVAAASVAMLPGAEALGRSVAGRRDELARVGIGEDWLARLLQPDRGWDVSRARAGSHAPS